MWTRQHTHTHTDISSHHSCFSIQRRVLASGQGAVVPSLLFPLLLCLLGRTVLRWRTGKSSCRLEGGERQTQWSHNSSTVLRPWHRSTSKTLGTAILAALAGGLEGLGLNLLTCHRIHQPLQLRLDQTEKRFVSQTGKKKGGQKFVSMTREQSESISIRTKTKNINNAEETNCDTHQSVEAHASTANKPFRTLCTVSWGTSGLSKKPITFFMTLASRRIKPITTHHSKQPASINTWRRYLKGIKTQKLVSHWTGWRGTVGARPRCISPELHLWLVWSFIRQLHGNVLQLSLAQAESGGVLINHRPITVHHWAGLCQVCGRANAVLFH